MADFKQEIKTCPDEALLGSYLDGTLKDGPRDALEVHLGSCEACLVSLVSAYESVATFKGKGKENFMKRLNWYFLAMAISFALSFILPRYFLQLLVATIIFGAKWIIDARNARILVMIYEAWRKGGEKGASRILEGLKIDPKNRL